MKRYIIVSVLLLVLSYQAKAQEQLSKRQQADRLFDRFEYFKAARLYTDVADKRKPDVKVLERLATCYRMMNNYTEAESWYAKAMADPKADAMSTYYYAEALQRNKKFTEAKEQYKVYGDKSGRSAEAATHIASCDSAALWMQQSSKYKVTNAQELNSKYSDWGASYYGKGGLVFTSERVSDRAIKRDNTYGWTGDPWARLYFSGLDGKRIDELPLIRSEYSAFKTDYHVGPMLVTASGDTAYITITTRAFASDIPVDKGLKKGQQRIYTRRLALIMAYKKDGRWTEFKSFPYNDIKTYSVGHAALSKDGNVLYFTSDMPGGEGKTDIWYCVKGADGNWGSPINCGKEINTPDDEAFATIGPKGELYYSSKGKIGMGGYDIYKSVGEKGQWSTPVNLKYPVNSTSDDFWFSTQDGVSGFLSSNREGGLGSDDIYRFNYSIPPPISPVVPKQDEVLKREVIPPYEPGKTYVLKNIYYDFDKWNIRADAALELDKLVRILADHPGLRTELSSHTDSRGTAEYNRVLSQRRAEAAVEYLIGKGIAKERLRAKGYGLSRLFNQCAKGVKCTDEEHQQNRRTEIKVLDK